MSTAESGDTEPPRTHAHRLLDAVPEDRVSDAVEMLRHLAEPEPTAGLGRRFRTVGVFDGEPDLGRRSKEIVRSELNEGSSKTA